MEFEANCSAGRLRMPCLTLCFVISTVVMQSPAFAGESPLKNSDIVALVKAGLGDDIVITKVEQAPEQQLDVSTDALIQLKRAGVSKGVIDAMLQRVGGDRPAGGLPQPQPRHKRGSRSADSPREGVRLATKGGDFDLTKLTGEWSGTFAYVTTLHWLNYPGPRAEVRTNDREPTLLIWSDANPQSRYFIVKLDTNEEEGDRSVKMGRSKVFTDTAPTSPDKTWRFVFSTTEERPGVWRLRLNSSLQPGEYGLWTQPAELYGFGIE